ncbi:MAG: hypothetical protein OXF89_04975 [Rhodospirillaceae bacterium]|nr:hypothetical protein [Rhodospirillaceae bacterium]MCY4065761.1 hypothetical protein [Rhodospirillaceae bacterium]
MIESKLEALAPAVARAWSAFDTAASLSSRVVPGAPILFFGDIEAYLASPLRVLTVGLNPSLHEFPPGEPFRRFPLLASDRDRAPGRYLDAMSAYFRTDPYRSWFNTFEPLLNGAGASYYGASVSIAIHTDICSPVATSPTWSKLDRTDRKALEDDGGRLWHMLLDKLQPQIVMLSVARGYLQRIEFAPMNEWRPIQIFEKTGDGKPRSQPYKVCARWWQVGGAPSLFVFGPAAQRPFGLLADKQKCEAGRIALKEFEDARIP